MFSVLSFVLEYKYIFLFYLLIAVFFYIKRKNLTYQAKVIILYRMKFGLKFINKCADKFREWIILLGYIGVGVGYLGLAVISYFLIKILYQQIFTPASAPGVSLVLPGINIPGIGILPFWYWIIAIFLIALIHEFAHGIVARAHRLDVKNTGIVLLGPIIGAFVEPDEKKMSKEKDIVQYSVLAAGPFSNIILGVLALLLLSFVFLPLQQGMVEPTGFTFDEYVDGSFPFAEAGIVPGTSITGINGEETLQFQEFSENLFCTAPGEKVIVNTEQGDYELVLAANPADSERSFMGIQQIRNEVQVKETYTHGIGKVAYYTLEWFNGMANGGKGFFFWLYLLSLGIGLFNLLPLPIVDGGRMLQITLHRVRGNKKGEKSFRKISFFFLLVLLLTLLYPWISNLFGV
jgi:membrane-associated protease RseP (regulator of RpoE activity)